MKKAFYSLVVFTFVAAFTSCSNDDHENFEQAERNPNRK